MSLEAISAVEKAEALAVQLKADAVAKAKQLAADAEAAGKAAIEAARARAAEEVAARSAEANAKAEAETKELWNSTENQKAVLRARAESRLDQAAEHIAERIVNGK